MRTEIFSSKRLSKRLNVCETSRKRSLRSGWGRARTAGRPGDSDSDGDDRGDEKEPVQVSRKSQKVANKHGW